MIQSVMLQVKCSVLEQKAIRDGLLSACKDSGTLLVAHSPLSQGLLTDKYVQSGGGGQADKVRPLLKMMQFIGALYGGKTVTQIALNYLVAQGMHHPFMQGCYLYDMIQNPLFCIDFIALHLSEPLLLASLKTFLFSVSLCSGKIRTVSQKQAKRGSEYEPGLTGKA